MKMNKKGFTLIEMLVVIAIIAVLVSIIIPTVSSATTKAAAATDAANLRSIVAEATTDYLNGAANSDGYVSFTPATSSTAASFTVNPGAPVAKSEAVKGQSATVKLDGAQVVAQFGDYTLADFQAVAENGGTLAATGSAHVHSYDATTGKCTCGASNPG